MNKRVIRMNVLPGEKTDGTGKICIHLFLKDEKGTFTEPHVLHPAINDDGNIIKQKLAAKPTRGRIACDRNKKPSIKPNKDGSQTILMRTDDANAVTCPKCLRTPECITFLKLSNGEQ